MKKLLFLGLIIIFSLALIQAVYAQDESSVEAADNAVEEGVTAEDLGFSEPTVLPTSKFSYFFKNLGRIVKSTFTFNPVKKAELQLQYANERLYEAKKVAELQPDDVKAQAVVEKSLDKFQQLAEKVNTKIEKFKEKGQVERVEQLLDKVTDSQFKQQKMMDTIHEKIIQSPEENKEKLRAIKEKSLENFGNLLEKVEDKDKIRERFEKIIGKEEDKLKHLKDLEIMERLGDEFSDENFKEGLIEAKEDVREGLIDYLNEQPGLREEERFELKLNELSTNEAYKLRVINFVGEELKERAVDERTLNNFENRLEEVQDERIDYLKGRLEMSESEQDMKKMLEPLELGQANSIEVLERVREQVQNPRAKEALFNAQEKQIEHLEIRMEKIENPERMEQIRNIIETNPMIKESFIEARPMIMNQMQEKIELRKEQRTENIQIKEDFPAGVQNRVETRQEIKVDSSAGLQQGAGTQQQVRQEAKEGVQERVEVRQEIRTESREGQENTAEIDREGSSNSRDDSQE